MREESKREGGGYTKKQKDKEKENEKKQEEKEEENEKKQEENE